MNCGVSFKIKTINVLNVFCGTDILRVISTRFTVKDQASICEAFDHKRQLNMSALDI